MKYVVVAVTVALIGIGVRAGDPGGTFATQLGDLDCSAFPTQADAQEHYQAHPGDPDGLDEDGDGIACEDFLPCPCDFPSLSSATMTESNASPAQTSDEASPAALPDLGGGPRDSERLSLAVAVLVTMLAVFATAAAVLLRRTGANRNRGARPNWKQR